MSTTEPVDALETADAYPKYNDYEGSGVDWLGDIPAHWDTAKLKFLCDRSAVYGANRSADEYTQDGVRFLRTTDIDESGALTSEGVYIDPDSVENYMLEDGDLLLSRSGTVGRSFIYSSTKHEPCAYAGYLVRFVLDREKLNPEYAFYFTKTGNFYEWLRSNSIESTIGNVSGDKYANMPTVVPPPEEQRAIATFLDRETGRIDALIEKKEELIDLLEEKRTALISRVVTKGLDRDVEMQDSGVEWLGEIPAHWETANLMHLTPTDRKIMYGIILPGPHHEGGVPIIKGGNVKPGELERENLNCTDPEIDAENAKSRVQADDIVYAIRGSIGEAEQVPKELEGANLTQDAARISPKDDIDGRWLLHVVRSAPFFAQLEARALGATVKGINIRDLKRASVPAPPLNEQLEIAKYLDAETSKIDALKVRIDDGIDRLKEYRTALISAAVTGQIDVREEVAVAPAE